MPCSKSFPIPRVAKVQAHADTNGVGPSQAEVNAKISLPVAKSSDGALLDGSASVVAAGGASVSASRRLQHLAAIVSGPNFEKQPFWYQCMELSLLRLLCVQVIGASCSQVADAAGGIGAAAAAALAGKQSIPHGNHGDNLRSAQK